MADFIDREGVEWILHNGGSPELHDGDMILGYERGNGCGGDEYPAAYGLISNLFDHDGCGSRWDIVIYRVVI